MKAIQRLTLILSMSLLLSGCSTKASISLPPIADTELIQVFAMDSVPSTYEEAMQNIESLNLEPLIEVSDIAQGAVIRSYFEQSEPLKPKAHVLSLAWVVLVRFEQQANHLHYIVSSNGVSDIVFVTVIDSQTKTMTQLENDRLEFEAIMAMDDI